MTEEYEKQIVDAAEQTWQGIGADVLIAFDIPDTSGKCLKRDQVIEIVLDNVRSHSPKIDFEEFDTLTYEKKIALMRKAFPYEEYGW